MSDLLNQIKNRAAEKGLAKDECAVEGCNLGNTEVVTLKPLDPIDHDEVTRAFCPEHQLWAKERNEFAEEMLEELREYRKTIGQANIDKIQRLAAPDKEVSKDILMGEYDTLEEAKEDEH